VTRASFRLTRRHFVQGAAMAGLGLLAGCGPSVSMPSLGTKVHRVRYLRSTPSDAANGPNVLAFQQGMRDLGYVEGENLRIEQRYADSVEQLREPVADLVRLQPEVILVAGVAAARGVLAVTTTIPIVSAGTGALDLVASGLALTHARPGGTVTGLSSPSLEGKQLQLLQEAVPSLARVAIVFDATVPGFQPSEQVEMPVSGAPPLTDSAGSPTHAPTTSKPASSDPGARFVPEPGSEALKAGAQSGTNHVINLMEEGSKSDRGKDFDFDDR